MRIALCTETVFPIYGVERRVYEMARRLPNYGIEPTIITSLGEKYDTSLDLLKASDHTISMAPKRNLGNCVKYSLNTFRLLSRKYDIIDANGHMALLPCFAGAKKSGRPIVATIHDIYGNDWKSMYKSRASFAGKYIERLLCMMPYDRLIALNKTAKKRLIGMGVPRERLEVIYSGIDTKKIDKIKAEKKNRNGVVYVGRLAPQKNLDILIRAFSRLKHNASLSIIGDGSELENLKYLAKSLGVDIEFTGNLRNDDVIKKMKEASILSLTSSRENFGIVPLEAMRCKTAVISTKTEGPIDYIENGKNGLLVDIGSIQQISDKIDMLLSDKRMLSRVQKNGFETSERFDWENIIRSIADMYYKILDESGKFTR